MILTAEHILALAPDAASAKAGSQQASPGKWSGLGASEAVLWGLCQGSGKEPYRTQIALAEPAFKCTCPSRKFPCKHGLGLYLLRAATPAGFPSDELPPWVADWMQSRGERAEKKAAKLADLAAPTSDSTPDSGSGSTAGSQSAAEARAAKALGQQKRQAQRDSEVGGGIDLLDTWLADLAREGLAGLKSKSTKEWDAMAARMVDAKASGLANRIRRANGLIHASSQPQWELPVARELGLLALLAHSFRRLGSLPPGLQADIKTAIGWSASQDDALAEPGVADCWHVYGHHNVQEDRISRRACYLRGADSGKWAMLLHFSAGGQMLPPAPPPGTWLQGTLHFYPSASPLRVVFGPDMHMVEPDAAQLQAEAAHPATVGALLDRMTQALAANPFTEQIPALLHVAPQLAPGTEPRWLLRAADDGDNGGGGDNGGSGGAALPLSPKFSQPWLLHCLAGGAPATLFGLWDGDSFLPHNATVQGHLHHFGAVGSGVAA